MNLKMIPTARKATMRFLVLTVFLSVISFSLCLFSQSSLLFEGEIQCIENPTPTHIEKPEQYVELEMVGKIAGDIDDEHFMAWPWQITANKQGDIYVFDLRLQQIFKFDKNNKFISVFGSAGQGPGEFSSRRRGLKEMYFGYDDSLYVSDTDNNKIIKFTADGKYARDIKLPVPAKATGGFSPVIMPNGDFFIRTGLDCTLDAYNINDREMKKRYSLLSLKDFQRSVILKVRKQDYLGWMFSDPTVVYYDLIPGNRLMVYLATTSTVFIFKEGRLEKKFDLWPKKVLDIYRKDIEMRAKKARKNDLLISKMFLNFFPDKDNENYFYLEGKTDGSDKKRFLYQFDLTGNLVKVLYAPVIARFLCKKNILVYAGDEDMIYIFKEKNNEKKAF